MTQPIPFDIDAEIARVTALLASLTAAKSAPADTAPSSEAPAPETASDETEYAPIVGAAILDEREDREHVVAGGELLADIAARYGVPADAIAFASAQAGRIINADHLPTGARLIIPGVISASASE